MRIIFNHPEKHVESIYFPPFQDDEGLKPIESEYQGVIKSSRTQGIARLTMEQVNDSRGNHLLQGALQDYIGNVDEISPGAMANMLLYSRHQEFGVASIDLVNMLSPEERRDTYTLLGSLTAKAGDVGLLFPEEIQDATSEAFGESITNLVFTLRELKKTGKLPDKLELKGGREVPIGKYTYEEALETISKLDLSLDKIIKSTLFKDTNIWRMNVHGKYGMYHLGDYGTVSQTVRLVARTSYDPAIEFGNKNGTQASIGFTIEEDGGMVPVFKDDQRSPFCIRVDNEGDSLALDIGSILGKEGSLGKKIADLIAVGDSLRSVEVGKDPWLNHNKRPYAGKGYEEPEYFAKITAEYVADLQRRFYEGRPTNLARLALEAQKAAS